MQQWQKHSFKAKLQVPFCSNRINLWLNSALILDADIKDLLTFHNEVDFIMLLFAISELLRPTTNWDMYAN